MPHAEAAIASITNLPLAICTNKPRKIVDKILDFLNIKNRFAIVIAGGDLPRIKPAPDCLQRIATQLNIDPREIVIVGDGPQDILCGKSIGARTIAVTSGYSHEAILRELRPTMLVYDLEALPDILTRWNNSTFRGRRMSQPQ